MALLNLNNSQPGVLGLSVLVLLLAWWVKVTSGKPRFYGVPAVGHGSGILSWITVIKLFAHASDMIQESYKKHKGCALKMPELSGWHLLLTSPASVDELRKAPEHVLSFNEAVLESLAMGYTMGHAVFRNPYHINIIRVQLTRNLTSIFPEIHEEVVASFFDLIPAVDDDWVTLPGFDTAIQAICRTSNRVFVGSPLCKDPDYIDLNIRCTVDVILAGHVVRPFPEILRPFARQFLTKMPQNTSRAMKHLGPIINERFSKMTLYGEKWQDKPNDLLQWFMDTGEEKDVRSLSLRILAANFAAIHTASMALTNALFRLAAHPQYAQPLRDEIDRIITQDGWSKASMQQLHKVDSFIKECMRMNSTSCLGMTRLALQDYTFQDGTFAPKGSMISVAAGAIQSDPELYVNPDVFDPWRFDRMRSTDHEGSRLETTSLDFLPFGHGQHACPGRYFSAAMLKCMLAHIVVTYDVKFEDEGRMPERMRFHIHDAPSSTAKVMFRKRKF